MNTQNVREYARIGQPPEFNFGVNMSRQKLTVWWGLCGNGQVVGPFLIERNVDGNRYLQMIINNVGEVFRGLWSFQDGAPAHCLFVVTDRLRELFGNRVVALGHARE